MMSKHSLLIELGTEELPPKTLKSLHDAFAKETFKELLEAKLVDSSTQAQPFASPRRLAVLVPEVSTKQPDQNVERFGPAVKAAFDAEGNPTPAATGFAKSCGVAVDALEQLDTDKGLRLAYTVSETGKSLDDLLTGILENVIKRLPIAKRMRWGHGEAEFVRPVKWLLALHGERTVACEVLGVQSSTYTLGHRFHSTGDSNGKIAIKSADDYEQTLLEQGHVVADFCKRRSMILEQINEAAKSLGGQIEDDPNLLDEVSGLVEYPSPIVGGFEEVFLEVPQECLVSSMRDHQKYFHVLNAHGKLMPHFITISNINSSNPIQVQEGNEKVLRARLSDAQFFWQSDQKTKLEERVAKLSGVMFHAKLGSLLDKTERLQQLAGKLASMLGGEPTIAQRGAQLAKADLVSEMVGEFDDLQGVMGHYYADRDNEASLVGDCIEQHYWPKFAGDELPQSAEAQAVSLADKLDSLVGIYAAAGAPTGDKDPYGLRRAALSVLRILIECQHTLGLPELISLAADAYAEQGSIAIDAPTQNNIINFIEGRLLPLYQNQGVATLAIKAVMAVSSNSPLDFHQRLLAIATFSQGSEAQDLSAANKRIANILKKQGDDVGEIIDTSSLSATDEINLHDSLIAIEAECIKLFNKGDYQQGLEQLARLRTPVDNFFENVMVMSDKPAERTNRLALLKRLNSLFLKVADISLLQHS